MGLQLRRDMVLKNLLRVETGLPYKMLRGNFRSINVYFGGVVFGQLCVRTRFAYENFFCSFALKSYIFSLFNSLIRFKLLQNANTTANSPKRNPSLKLSLSYFMKIEFQYLHPRGMN